jgi:hypothetical protein
MRSLGVAVITVIAFLLCLTGSARQAGATAIFDIVFTSHTGSGAGLPGGPPTLCGVTTNCINALPGDTITGCVPSPVEFGVAYRAAG